MAYKPESDKLTSRTQIRDIIGGDYDELDLSDIVFVSRGAAHELQNSDLNYFGTDKVEKVMETKYS